MELRRWNMKAFASHFSSFKNHNENRHLKQRRQMVHCNNHGVFMAETCRDLWKRELKAKACLKAQSSELLKHSHRFRKFHLLCEMLQKHSHLLEAFLNCHHFHFGHSD